jgi:ribosomal protein L14E/L6E/L27E
MIGEFQKGRVVKSLAGRDKGYLLVIIEANEKTAFVCDGKERPLNRPKSKNIRHLELTSLSLKDNEMATDRALRKALRRINAENCNV